MGDILAFVVVPLLTYFIGYTSGKQLTKTRIRNALSPNTFQMTAAVHKAIDDA